MTRPIRDVVSVDAAAIRLSILSDGVLLVVLGLSSPIGEVGIPFRPLIVVIFGRVLS